MKRITRFSLILIVMLVVLILELNIVTASYTKTGTWNCDSGDTAIEYKLVENTCTETCDANAAIESSCTTGSTSWVEIKPNINDYTCTYQLYFIDISAGAPVCGDDGTGTCYPTKKVKCSSQASYVARVGGPQDWEWKKPGPGDMVAVGTPTGWDWKEWSPDSGRKIMKGGPQNPAWGQE